LDWWCKRFDLRLGVRHGDTSKKERNTQSIHPPEILITTPETLQAILTGRTMRRHLSHVRWVIVDEIHELAGEKRGSQFCLAMERMRLVCRRDFQIIGLSATVGSPDKIARFLVGVDRSCEIAQVPVARRIQFEVSHPNPVDEDYELAKEINTFPEVAARLRYMRDLIERYNSVLLFTNTRSIAEILTSRFRVWDIDIPIGIHHGSLSKTSRISAETDLKECYTKGIVCTSSLELGIDIGSLDTVIQYNSPRQVTRLLQRVGRSGHTVGGVANGVIITQDSDDTLEAMVIARRALIEEMEEMDIPELSYDPLIHEIAGLMMIERRWRFNEVLEYIRRSYPYRKITKMQLRKILAYMHKMRFAWVSFEDEIFLKPRYNRALYKYYFENLSMIPDVRQFLVVDDKNPIGVLDEEFVAEYGEIGKKFIMSGLVWKIEQIYGGAIYVHQESDPTGVVPSWVGEEIPVPYEVAMEVGRIRRRVEEEFLSGFSSEEIIESIAESYPIDVETVENGLKETMEQVEAGIPLPTDRRITIEGEGDYIIIHCAFGLLVNRTLSRMFGHLLSEKFGSTIGVQQDPYRIILKSKLARKEDVNELFETITDSDVERLAKDALMKTGLYKRRIIHVARKCGALSKGYDFSKLDISVFDEIIKEEALRTMFIKDVDLEDLLSVLKMIKERDIIIEMIDEDEISPIAMIGMESLQRHSDLIPSTRRQQIIIQSVRVRLLNELRTFVCTNCWNYVETMKIADLNELICKECGSTRIGILKSEKDAFQLCDKVKSGKIPKKYENLHRQAIKSSELVFRYGHAAALVLAGKINVRDAAQVLKKENRDDNRLVELIIEAERIALKRRFTYHPMT
jgi:ATP-dependent Lhr-like helicase